jgi:hypothetical protein
MKVVLSASSPGSACTLLSQNPSPPGAAIPTCQSISLQGVTCM